MNIYKFGLGDSNELRNALLLLALILVCYFAKPSMWRLKLIYD